MLTRDDGARTCARTCVGPSDGWFASQMATGKRRNQKKLFFFVSPDVESADGETGCLRCSFHPWHNDLQTAGGEAFGDGEHVQFGPEY